MVVLALALTRELSVMAASREAPLVREPRSMPMLKPTEKALAAPVLVMASTTLPTSREVSSPRSAAAVRVVFLVPMATLLLKAEVPSLTLVAPAVPAALTS